MRPERIQFVNDIAEMMSSSAYVYMVTYKGLTVAELSELRDKLAENNAECHVVKNTFIRKSAEKLEWTTLAETKLTGDTAIIVGEDCCSAAKTVKELAKKFKQLSPKLGYMDGKVLTADEIDQLAELPSIDVMRSMLLGVLTAPARNLAGVLHQKVSTIAYVLQAIVDKKSN